MNMVYHFIDFSLLTFLSEIFYSFYSPDFIRTWLNLFHLVCVVNGIVFLCTASCVLPPPPRLPPFSVISSSPVVTCTEAISTATSPGH